MDAMKNWFKGMFSRDRRNNQRRAWPSLLAYYWDGAAPKSHQILDISSTGLFLLTPERWYPGTLVMVSLQRIGAAETDPDRSITVNAKVVRLGPDGVGLELVMPEESVPERTPNGAGNGANRKTFRRFLQRLLEDRGEALPGYILLLPVLFLLIVDVLNFGGFFAWITAANDHQADRQAPPPREGQ
jgi:PilZ domain